MLCRLNEYEKVMDSWLSDNQVEHILVDQRRRTSFSREKLKSFDLMFYPSTGPELFSEYGFYGSDFVIAEIKGRRFKGSSIVNLSGLQNWVGTEDIRGMLEWESFFNSQGDKCDAIFIFVYKFVNPEVETDGLDVYEFDGNNYIFFAVRAEDYAKNMKLRSSGWQTVFLPVDMYRKYSFPLNRACV